MKIKKSIINDYLIRNQSSKNEYKLRVLKILIRLKFVDSFHLLNIIFRIKRLSSFCKIKNKCFFTSRNKSIYSKIKLSRIKLKEYINNGLIIGFSKYSW